VDSQAGKGKKGVVDAINGSHGTHKEKTKSGSLIQVPRDTDTSRTVNGKKQPTLGLQETKKRNGKVLGDSMAQNTIVSILHIIWET